MPNANINPDILIWARERAQMQFDVLAEKLKIPQEKLGAWEDGIAKPSFNQAKKIASLTRIPFGFLFLKQPPEESLPLPDLRTVNTKTPEKPSAGLLEIVRIVMQRQAWYREYMLEQGQENNPVVGRFRFEDNPDVIVQNMRSVLGTANHPERGSWEDYFRDLVRRIENIGVLVFRQSDIGHFTRPLSVSEFRGFAIADTVAPAIFINQADAPGARLFTLIHELSHIWIGKSGISDADLGTQQKEEIFCNAVAAEFLVPKIEFLEQWNSHFEDWRDNLVLLKAHFHVSQWTIARRALTLKRINTQSYYDFVNALHEKYRSRKSTGGGGPTYYRTKHSQISDRFSRAVVSEALSGRLLLRDAGKLLGMKPNNIRKYGAELKV